MEIINIFSNTRGQAAMTDALYFLTIVTALAGMMFLFSNNYGASLEKKMTAQYELEFASSAVKTILYSNIPRNPHESAPNGLPVTVDNARELDYFLTQLKEDYANDRKLDPVTLNSLLQNLQTIMKPVDQAYDYMFYVYIPERYYRSLESIQVSAAAGEDSGSDAGIRQAPQVIIAVLKKTRFEFTPEPISGTFRERLTILNPGTSITTDYYFCRPQNFNTILFGILPNLGKITVPVESRVYLTLFSHLFTDRAALDSEKFVANANLIMWVPERFPDEFENFPGISEPIPDPLYPGRTLTFGELQCNPAAEVLAELNTPAPFP